MHFIHKRVFASKKNGNIFTSRMNNYSLQNYETVPLSLNPRYNPLSGETSHQTWNRGLSTAEKVVFCNSNAF